jgi:hypothetical protein
MQKHSIVNRGLKFKVDVSNVAHVVGRKVDAGVRDAESHDIVEQVWKK